MLPPRFLTLLVILLAVQGWCKPAKNTEGEEYSDDDPPSDYNDDDTADDDNDPGAFEEPPQIISKSESIHVRTGNTIKLPCVVKNAENFAITWKKDNEFLYYDSTPMTTDRNRIIRLPDNTLVIHNATVNDSSNNYECSVLAQPPITIIHRVLVDSERAPITPPTPTQTKPLIRVTPGKKVEVSAGESVTLGCEVRGDPAPEIKWYHENERVRDNVTIEGNHITIKNVDRHDSGRYQCLIENGSNHPPVEAINVIVNYAPEIETKNELVHTGLGVETDLACIVYAHPHAKVKWYKDQTEIFPQKGRIEMRANKTLHILEILHTEAQDLGEYTCVATNKMGRDEKVISVTGAPSQAVIAGGEMTNGDKGLILKWQLESYSPITEYKLEYRRKGEDSWMIVKPTVTNGKGKQFTVEQLIDEVQPGSYEAILTARNDFGWSQPSVPHVFTGEYAAEEAQNVTGAAATHRPLRVILALFLVFSSCAFTNL